MPEVVNAQRLIELGQGIRPAPGLRLDESLPLPAHERLAWERRLNRYRRSCGCAEGAVGLCVGLAAVLIASIFHHGPWTTSNVAAAIGVPLALLIGGKLVGRHRDRLRFRRACGQLLLRLAVTA